MSQINRRGKARTVRRTINAASAEAAVGPITPGIEVYGLSKGQFSLVELVEHVLAATGPAHLTFSTWTAANADLAHTRSLIDSGLILSARWIVDYSFPSRQPAYCELLRERFGDDSIRVTANHAKFVMLRNESWNVVIRTSMNLNLNRRLESYEISDDSALADWLQEIVEDAFDGGAAGIAYAVDNPSAAGKTSAVISGAVERRAQEMSFQLSGKGVSFD